MKESTLRLTLAANYLAGNLGRFALMPVLAILLASRSGGDGWARTGAGMFGFMLCAGLSSLLAARWLPRFSYRTALPASMVFAAVGFGLLPYAGNALGTVTLLFLAGFGISVHTVLSRVLIAEGISSETGRNTMYAIQQIVTNIAASLGPFIAAALYVSGDGRPLLLLVTVAYLGAAVVLVVGLPRRLRPPEAVRTGNRRPVAALLLLLRDGEFRRVTVVTTVGAFVYAQFYSAFALLVALGIHAAALKGALLAGPAVAIVLLQAAVTAVANRRLRAGVRPVAILMAANLVFAVAMLVLGLGIPLTLGASIAMSLFAVAEMMFTPMVSTAFNRLDGVSRVELSNLQQVAWTAGEAVGSLCGGGLFLLCYQNDVGNVYWLLVAGIAVVVPGLVLRGGSGRPGAPVTDRATAGASLPTA